MGTKLSRITNTPPQKLLVALLTACTAFPAVATQYVGPLDPSDTGNTAFDAIKSGSEGEGYVYNFQDGDEIISSSASDRFRELP